MDNADVVSLKTGPHTDEEIKALFPQISSPGGVFYLNRIISGYQLLCSALMKGGYSVADEDVILLLMRAYLLDNVPNWKGISGTAEGLDLDLFLDQFREKTDKGFRISSQKLKNCFGGFPARLALHNAA